MRIAQVSPLIERVPPRRYGGTERVVGCLTDALVKMGHEVTLFASGDSLTTARHIAVVEQSLREGDTPRDPCIWHLRQLMEVVRRAQEFDIVHFHTGYMHFPVWRGVATPQVTTIHNRVDTPDLDVVYDQFPDMALVSISDAQRRTLPRANWVATVYNGTPAATFTPQLTAGGYFAFLGRFTPEKGPEDAIEIAKRLNTPLKMAAKVDATDQEYFETRIRPQLAHPLIEYVGEVDDAAKNRLLGGAKALLFPIAWPEPFGLVMTEAMACGTPVIAYDQGSVREVMRHGVSGFVVHGLEEAIAAAQQLDQIDRSGCRTYFEANFSVQRMAENYVKVYRSLLKPQKPSHIAAPPVMRHVLPINGGMAAQTRLS